MSEIPTLSLFPHCNCSGAIRVRHCLCGIPSVVTEGIPLPIRLPRPDASIGLAHKLKLNDKSKPAVRSPFCHSWFSCLARQLAAHCPVRHLIPSGYTLSQLWLPLHLLFLQRLTPFNPNSRATSSNLCGSALLPALRTRILV